MPELSTATDFAARDADIAINSYTTVLRHPRVPHELFATYWRDVHGPLCSRIPGLGWYVQHHLDREQDAHLWPGNCSPLPERHHPDCMIGLPASAARIASRALRPCRLPVAMTLAAAA